MDREALAMFVFKVELCQKKAKHPWEECIYCHPRENARRRDVRKHRYVAEPCPDYANKEFCDLGDDCPFAHGIFEINLHPSKYCTKACTKFPHCDRKICFFAHGDEQLRQPDHSYGYSSVTEAELVRQDLLRLRARKDSALLGCPAGFVAPQLPAFPPLLVNPAPISNPAFLTHATGIAGGFRCSSMPAVLPSPNYVPQESFRGSSLPAMLPSPAYMTHTHTRLGCAAGFIAPQAKAIFPQQMPPPLLNSSAVAHVHAVGIAEGFRGSSLPATQPSPNLTSQSRGSSSPKATDQHAKDELLYSSSSCSSDQSSSTNMTPISVEGAGPRMSLKKARELGLQPQRSRSFGSLSGSPDTLGKLSPEKEHQHCPGCQDSPQRFCFKASSQCRLQSTVIISPSGHRILLEEAVTLVSYLASSERGAPTRAATMANLSSAITTLYGLGYTLAEKDDVEEGSASEESSPDTLRRNVSGFGNLHLNTGLQYTTGPANGTLMPPMTPTPHRWQESASLTAEGIPRGA